MTKAPFQRQKKTIHSRPHALHRGIGKRSLSYVPQRACCGYIQGERICKAHLQVDGALTFAHVHFWYERTLSLKELLGLSPQVAPNLQITRQGLWHSINEQALHFFEPTLSLGVRCESSQIVGVICIVRL